jgi:uncharacterized protein YndB with AHSA1/START domain
MKRKLLIALAVLGGLIFIFLIVVVVQPADYRVERSATFAAEPSEVFAQVNDLRQWENWSPWAKLDPNAKNSFEGASEGEGAIFRWSGNSDVGEGSMTIVESRPYERIRLRLDFVKPMEGTADVEFQFQPQGEQTHVTWSMRGKNNFIGKAMCLFMDMDAMIGGDYEKGLANMKGVVETERGEDASAE